MVSTNSIPKFCSLRFGLTWDLFLFGNFLPPPPPKKENTIGIVTTQIPISSAEVLGLCDCWETSPLGFDYSHETILFREIA